MFPQLCRATTRAPRFPRSRGDVPHLGLHRRARARFSPLTRGCSCLASAHTCWITVFPAHAGMFLKPIPMEQVEQSFPRSRGDVPMCAKISFEDSLFSPLTRGCSHREHGQLLFDLVFPAHAGMFPDGIVHVGAKNGFPRSRGDVPSDLAYEVYKDEFSPLTRGCSILQSSSPSTFLVFPAHAGMFRVDRY